MAKKTAMMVETTFLKMRFLSNTAKFAVKSVDFAAKSVYFVAAHAAQRQNQFDLWLNQLTFRSWEFIVHSS